MPDKGSRPKVRYSTVPLDRPCSVSYSHFSLNWSSSRNSREAVSTGLSPFHPRTNSHREPGGNVGQVRTRSTEGLSAPTSTNVTTTHASCLRIVASLLPSWYQTGVQEERGFGARSGEVMRSR